MTGRTPKPVPKPRRPGAVPSAAPAPSRGRYEIVGAQAGAGLVAELPPAVATVAGTTTVSATEAARHFSDLVSRACYQGETFVIERGGRAICQLGPLDARRCSGADLLELLARLPRPDEEYLAAVESITQTQSPVEPSPWET